MLPDIKNMLDVMTFIDLITKEVGDGNPFEEINSLHRYTCEAAAVRRQQMDKCFEVCARQTRGFIYLAIVLLEEARDNPARA